MVCVCLYARRRDAVGDVHAYGQDAHRRFAASPCAQRQSIFAEALPASLFAAAYLLTGGWRGGRQGCPTSSSRWRAMPSSAPRSCCSGPAAMPRATSSRWCCRCACSEGSHSTASPRDGRCSWGPCCSQRHPRLRRHIRGDRLAVACHPVPIFEDRRRTDHGTGARGPCPIYRAGPAALNRFSYLPVRVVTADMPTLERLRGPAWIVAETPAAEELLASRKGALHLVLPFGRPQQLQLLRLDE